jgi:hypothetical protein
MRTRTRTRSPDELEQERRAQLAAIAAYAEANTLTIVRTYADEGRNGLRAAELERLEGQIR